MTVTFPTGWFRTRTVTLQEREVEWTDQWFHVRTTDRAAYRALVARAVKQRKSPSTAIVTFLVLTGLPVGFYALASYLENAAFHVGTILFAIPAVISFREILRSFQIDIIFLEECDGGARVRFRYPPRFADVVAPCIAELRRRIKAARDEEGKAAQQGGRPNAAEPPPEFGRQ